MRELYSTHSWTWIEFVYAGLGWVELGQILLHISWVQLCRCISLKVFNLLKSSDVRQLHLKVFNVIEV